jgi:multidrug efflux system membrane fusion protein
VPVVTAKSVVKAVPIIIPAVGVAEPVATVQVRAQVTGQLSQIHFKEGQEVRKGELLFTLDSRPFEAALRQAEAVLARDTAQAKNAQSQQSRYKELFDRGLIPRDQYEAQNATASALEATLAADRSQIENARLNLQYTRIMAPISGRTGALNVHQGDLVRANDTAPLVVINQLAPIYVSFSVPGRFLPEIRRNQAKSPLHIEAHSKPGDAPGAPQQAPPSVLNNAPPAETGGGGNSTSLEEGGTVSFIDNAVDPTTGTIKLKGTFDNEDHALWPGLFVQVDLILSIDPNAVVVPAVAVQASQAGTYVYVVKADRTVELRPVTVERQQGEEMVIAKGLTGGEEVVTDGHLRLTDGAHVVTGTRGETPGRAGGAASSGDSGNGTGRRGNREGNQS